LKKLKTAKYRFFGVQAYQQLSKSHDFAGETISFRFRFVLPFFRFARNAAQDAKKPQWGKKFGTSEKSFFFPLTH